MIVRLTESDIRNMVKKSIRRIIKEGWTDDFSASINKNEFYRLLQGYNDKSWGRRLFSRKPKDPYPEVEDPKQMADNYCKTYNKEEAIFQEFQDGSAVQTRMRFDSNLMPVLVVTHRSTGHIDHYIFIARYCYDKNGNPIERGATSYEDEGGYFSGMPDEEYAGMSYKSRGIIQRKINEFRNAVSNALSAGRNG